MRLRFIYRRGPSLLVVDNVRLTKRGRAGARNSCTRLTGRATVSLFILVP